MRGKQQAKDNAELLIKENKIFNLETAKKYRRGWQEYFQNQDKVVIDLGMGSGLFLKNLIAHDAQAGMKKNYLGIEIKGERVFKAYKKLAGLFAPGNLVIINMLINKLNQVFGKAELDEIYLIYPDPWPKDRHAKHRMVSPDFLKMYEIILKKDGLVYFKTDNFKLFNYAREQFKAKRWQLLEESNNLLASHYWLKDVESDYEKVFKLRNKKFYYLKYKFGCYKDGRAEKISMIELD